MHALADAAAGAEAEVVAGGGVRVGGRCGGGLGVVEVAGGVEGAGGLVADGVHVDGPVGDKSVEWSEAREVGMR